MKKYKEDSIRHQLKEYPPSDQLKLNISAPCTGDKLLAPNRTKRCDEDYTLQRQNLIFYAGAIFYKSIEL